MNDSIQMCRTVKEKEGVMGVAMDGWRTFAKDNLDGSADIGAVAIFEDIR